MLWPERQADGPAMRAVVATSSGVWPPGFGFVHGIFSRGQGPLCIAGCVGALCRRLGCRAGGPACCCPPAQRVPVCALVADGIAGITQEEEESDQPFILQCSPARIERAM